MHNEGWQFVEVGRFIERADKTTRILDVLHAAFPERGLPQRAQPSGSAAEWAAVLRSCSAWDAYKSIYGAEVRPDARGRLPAAERGLSALGALLRRGTQPRAAADLRCGGRPLLQRRRAASGRFLAELRFATVEDLLSTRGLHACLDWVQQQLGAIGQAVYDSLRAARRWRRGRAPSGPSRCNSSRASPACLREAGSRPPDPLQLRRARARQLQRAAGAAADERAAGVRALPAARAARRAPAPLPRPALEPRQLLRARRAARRASRSSAARWCARPPGAAGAGPRSRSNAPRSAPAWRTATSTCS